MSRNEKIKSLADVTRFHAAKRPERIATVFEDQTTTYGVLDSHASQVANGIIGAGIAPQTRVGFLGKNSDIYFELLFGAAKANVILVGINWRLAPPEVEYIVNDAEMEMLFVEQDFFGVIDQVRGQLSNVKQIVSMSGAHDGWPAFLSWRDSQDSTDPVLPIGAEDVCCQMYTSGTTGNPKGVQMTNRGFFALRATEGRAGAWAEWDEDEVIMVPMPVFHIGGTGWGFQGFYYGASVVVLEQAEPGDIIEAIQKYQVTKIFIVPAVLRAMLQHDSAKSADFSHVKVVMYGASPIPEDVLERAIETFQCPFVQLYGMTETNGTIVYLAFEEHKIGSERMKAAGIPYDEVEIIIGDANDSPLPAREVGEILIKSPSIMKGYWNLPEATEAALKGGWYHSGDAGYMDEDGFIYVYDRINDMIVSGGENIYPAEIESAMSLHPAVGDIAVIGVPSERWGEEVKAIIVRTPGEDASEDELIAFTRTRIAGFKTPKSIEFVDELPRNPSGKLLKKELRAPYWEGRERQVG